MKSYAEHKNVLELLSHKKDYDMDLYQHICDYSCHSRADLPYRTLFHMILLIYTMRIQQMLGIFYFGIKWKLKDFKI